MSSKSGAIVARLFRRAKQFFHMLIGIVFLLLTAAGTSVSIELWKDYQQTPGKVPWVFSMVASFTVLLLIFSLYSFLRARSVR